MRYLNDGSILFSRGEQLPKHMDGYVVDRDDKYHFLPEPEPCIHRQCIKRLKPCKELAIIYQCTLLGQDVNMKICNECDLNE